MIKQKLVLAKTPIWDRQPGETPGQYLWFTRYMEARLDGGSLTAVSKKYDRKPSYERVLRNWSYLNHWVSRIEAYRDFLEMEKQKQRLQDIQEMGERQAKNGMLMQQYALAWFQANPDMGKTLTPDMALRFFIEGMKAERTARGAATEIRAEAELPEETRKRMESIYSESMAETDNFVIDPDDILDQKEEDEETETDRG